MTTGSGRLFSTLDHYLVTSQMSSFATAFFTVFGVIFVVFRSARFGLLTIVPNVLPVVAVLGVMGYLGHLDEHRHRDGGQRRARAWSTTTRFISSTGIDAK